LTADDIEKLMSEQNLNEEENSENGKALAGQVDPLVMRDSFIPGYKVDPRECQDCKHFKDMGMMQIPICNKLMMGVSRTMHVTFKETDGTCFEHNEEVSGPR